MGDRTVYSYFPTPFDDELEELLRDFCGRLPETRRGGRPKVIRTDHIRIVNLDYSHTVKTWIAYRLDRIYDDVCRLAKRYQPGDVVMIYRDPIDRTVEEGTANLLKPLISHGYVDGGHLEQWVVEFVDNGEKTTRLIHCT